MHSVLDLRFVGPDDGTWSNESERALLVETHSFNYDVRRTQDGVCVTIRNYQWKRFLFSLLWTTVWVLAAVKAILAWDRNFFIFLSIPFSALFAGLGVYSVVASVLSHTLTLLPSELRVRSSFFGLSKTKLISRSDIESFGFGKAGHGLIPVLRLALRNPSGRRTPWTEFAQGTTEREVDAFLQNIEAQGFQLPH
jgi:hypothetical protein